MWCQNFRCMFFCFITKHACDGQRDGQNYDPQDRASIAASSGKNWYAEFSNFNWFVSCAVQLDHCVTNQLVWCFTKMQRFALATTDKLTGAKQDNEHYSSLKKINMWISWRCYIKSEWLLDGDSSDDHMSHVQGLRLMLQWLFSVKTRGNASKCYENSFQMCHFRCCFEVPTPSDIPIMQIMLWWSQYWFIMLWFLSSLAILPLFEYHYVMLFIFSASQMGICKSLHRHSSLENHKKLVNSFI